MLKLWHALPDTDATNNSSLQRRTLRTKSDCRPQRALKKVERTMELLESAPFARLCEPRSHGLSVVYEHGGVDASDTSHTQI